MKPPLAIEVTRGSLVESVHEVAGCAVDVKGAVLYAAGDIERPIYLRSAAKPFIAAAVVESGAAERFGFDQREIAVMTGSHAGEPFHVTAVLSILRKIAMDASALQCGIHWPYDEAAAESLRRAGERPTALHNNCSGKHAGILALSKMIESDPATYMSVENPAQRQILELCARLCDEDARSWPIGIDGCGIPVFATSLRNAARAFARLATLAAMDDRDAQALSTVRSAMLACPQYVAGTFGFDTLLMQSTAGTLVSKAGAEGIHGVAALPLQFGYVSKVLDGSARARGPSTMAALRALGAVDAEIASGLSGFSMPDVYDRAGRVVGEVRASHVAIETVSDRVV